MARLQEEKGLLTLVGNEDCSEQLINDDIRPTALEERTWNKWHIASLWVGMSVCIPTYMLASNMITGGLSWKEAICMILLGNLIVSVPMVLNGHAGTRYGIPFPVLGRAAFGTIGIQIPSILRALVACGWFGIQTWIGGLAIAAIAGALMGDHEIAGQWSVQFVGFLIFWAIQMGLVLKGTESIKWLETLAAPLLIVIGLVMLWWGVSQGGGLSHVLSSSYQFSKPSITMTYAAEGQVNSNKSDIKIQLNLMQDAEGKIRAQGWRYRWLDFKDQSKKAVALSKQAYQALPPNSDMVWNASTMKTLGFPQKVEAQFTADINGKKVESAVVHAQLSTAESQTSTPWMTYFLWLTAMVAFWATLALNISDITRYAASQKDQVWGQILGLPTTMTLYAFIGVAVTCAAIVVFPDILITQDAPWDPIRLIARFHDQPALMIFAQIAILIATLSTNIAANVISPANSFANLYPQKISFRMGGLITGVIGILILPWKLMGVIIGFLLTYGAILGPVVGVLLADYYVIRNTKLDLQGLYQENGPYQYNKGFHVQAFISLGLGVSLVLAGLYIPELKFLYDIGWFSGFTISFISYCFLVKRIPDFVQESN